MGEVYLAVDTKAARKAVIKLLPERFTGDPARITRFQQEARALVALNHPNIVTTYEIGEEDSTYYIASELIEGESLRQQLSRGPMALERVTDLGIQIASALAAAHKAGVIHRDIKPENIMLREDGYAKVVDFGIAKLTQAEIVPSVDKKDSQPSGQTVFGSRLGTLRYMSPEQIRGDPVDARTDIWSLGVVLYEMVTGRAPFSEPETGDPGKAVQTSTPAPLPQHGTTAARELQQIVNKALRENREERFPTAGEMLEALRKLKHKLEFAAELKRAPMWLRWMQRPYAVAVAVVGFALAISLPFLWSKLATKLTGPEKGALLGKPTNNPHAYDAYLRGLAYASGPKPGYYDRNTLDAMEAFKEAVKLDPNFTLGWVWLARVGSLAYFNLSTDDVQSLHKTAENAAANAIRLDGSLPEAQLAEGYFQYYCERNYRSAITWFKKARDRAPNEIEPLKALAIVSRRKGDWQTALDYLRAASELDPRNVPLLTLRARVFFEMRQYQSALDMCDSVLKLDPDSIDALTIKTEIYQAKAELGKAAALLERLPSGPGSDLCQIQRQQKMYERRYSEAIEMCKAAVADRTLRSRIRMQEYVALADLQEAAGDIAGARQSWQQIKAEVEKLRPAPEGCDPNYRDWIATAYTVLGETEKAKAALRDAQARIRDDEYAATDVAEFIAYAAVHAGDYNTAIDQVDFSARRFGGLTYADLKLNPVWNPLRANPRFERIVASLAPK
jgi:tetratricopeptide (TPR) repeat protein